MTLQDIGWYFPPTKGGREDGFNDPGIAHFTGNPLSSLARETIQNSLDARKEESKPVEVVFELVSVTPDDIGGHELGQALDACKSQAEVDADKTVVRALEVAGNALQQGIRCLRVSDRNTTGLIGKNWHALIKMQGLSQKPGLEGAGGSHGIGKYAPFAVSTLRSVFYWTCYADESGLVEQLQGKAVLMSHQTDEATRQGTGFYGIRQDCMAVKDTIPRVFRLLDSGRDPIHGTSLLITGFREGPKWQERIAASIIENFFYAIDSGSLKVIVEPEDTISESLEIDDSSLGYWFDKLVNQVSNQDLADEDGSALKRARDYWRLSDGTSEPIEKQDPEFGHCRLWIGLGGDLPSRIALVRRTGMLITDQQVNLKRFPLHASFAALCVFEDPRGNELLRRMENPQHNQFEPERLSEEDRPRGRRALKRIVDWIRGEVRKVAGPVEGNASTALSELNALLPDLHPEEPFDDPEGAEGGPGAERAFGERVIVRHKPIRHSAPALSREEEGQGEEREEGSGDDTGFQGGGGAGENGGENGTSGAGEGEGEGGTGGKGGGRVRRLLPISRVRTLPIQSSDNRYRISFLSETTATARLEIDEAGDSFSMPLHGLRAADGFTLDGIALTVGERTALEVISDSPIQDRALRIVAVEVE